MEYLRKDNWKSAVLKDNCFRLTIHPFQYNDGRKPRLPRKRSTDYKLTNDVEYFFRHVFSPFQRIPSNGKFKIEVTVHCGKDGLGKADLDNYCKAIFDGITKTEIVWIDDKQIDELKIKRTYVSNESSSIDLTIEPIV
jgi:Holliday junction resolvase RusA-like endonuclease